MACMLGNRIRISKDIVSNTRAWMDRRDGRVWYDVVCRPPPVASTPRDKKRAKHITTLTIDTTIAHNAQHKIKQYIRRHSIMNTLIYFTKHVICNFTLGAIMGAFAFIPLAILIDATFFGSIITIGLAFTVFGPASPE